MDSIKTPDRTHVTTIEHIIENISSNCEGKLALYKNDDITCKEGICWVKNNYPEYYKNIICEYTTKNYEKKCDFYKKRK